MKIFKKKITNEIKTWEQLEKEGDRKVLIICSLTLIILAAFAVLVLPKIIF